MTVLKIDNLSKTYSNGVEALCDISLEISAGIFGLLGPNGAGKSTLMRTIATLQDADSGSAYLGPINILEDPIELRKVLGYLPQQFGLYPRLSSEMLLHHFAVLKGITNRKERDRLVDYLLQKVNLFDVRKQKLSGFSGGMKQRFGIAQALINDPKLLIVDEPTAGLDPEERNRFFNLLSEISEQTVVLFSTHIVDDVKQLCSKMAIMNKGRVVIQGSPHDIMQDMQGMLYEKTISREDLHEHQNRYRVIGERLILGQPTIRIFSKEEPGNGFTPTQTQLEDVYMMHISNAKLKV